jgi:phosphohistidine phosphatase SixA
MALTFNSVDPRTGEAGPSYDEARAEDVRAAVAGRGREVVVVGHQPDCGRIAAALTGGEEPAFPAAGMVVIEM